MLGVENIRRSTETLERLGFHVRFSPHFYDDGPGRSAPVGARVDDLHDAFLDDEVDVVFPAIGGWTAIELLPHLDWTALASHRKVLCGFSDITVLLHAFAQKDAADAIFSPNFSDLAAPTENEYTLASFVAALNGEPLELTPAKSWSSNRWYQERFRSVPRAAEGLRTLLPGRATGATFAATLSVFLLMLGTPYALDLTDKVLFIEDYAGADVNDFRRAMHVLALAPAFATVRGIVLGRFHPGSSVHPGDLRAIFETLPIPPGCPVVYGADFGHTDPKASIPLGVPATVVAGPSGVHVAISARPQLSETS